MRRLFQFQVVSGALGLAFVLGACGPPASSSGPGPSTSVTRSASAGAPSSASAEPTSSAPASATAAPAPSATGTPTQAPAAGWTSYTTADGQLAFDHPETWTVRDADGAAPGGVSVEVIGENGKLLASLRTNMVTGAECAGKQPYSLIVSEPLPLLEQAGGIPRFVFESRTNPAEPDPVKMTTFAYGITAAPEPTGPTACPMSHFFTWPPSGAMFGGIYDPFDTTPGNPPHADTPEVYAETGEFMNIRKMITSLRPAG